MKLFFLLLLLSCKPKKIPVQGNLPDQAQATSSGLHYQVIKKGYGTDQPDPTSNVTVHYQGWLSNGDLFDSSIERGAPATFPLDKVIPGWTEGLQLMSEGAIYRFWIPPELAYNNKPGTPRGTLIFDIELISFMNRP